MQNKDTDQLCLFCFKKGAGNSREKVPGFYHQLAPAVPGECGGFVFEPNQRGCNHSFVSAGWGLIVEILPSVQCSPSQCMAFGRDLVEGKSKSPLYPTGGCIIDHRLQ